LALDRHGSEGVAEIVRARRFDQDRDAMKEDVLQIGRYGIVGGTAAVSYVGVVVFFSRMIGAAGAAILAQVIATTISYLGHRTFTFRSSAAHRRAIPRFLVVTAAAAVVNVGVTWFASSILHTAAIVTSIMAISAIALVSYALGRLWTFRTTYNIQAEK
jgi:putative flippase GtrA